jgi:hypothetical protein
MSDYYLHLIPEDLQYVPLKERVERVIDILKELCPGIQVEVTTTQKVRFIDPGSNLQAIYCPKCRRQLDMVWWQQVMSTKYATNFTDMDVETPCCGYRTRLDRLEYDWPAGFARFSISLLNPDCKMSEQDIQKISQLLTVGVKVIYAHY